MSLADLIDAHIDRQADITVAAQPVSPEDATSMGIFRFDRAGQIVAFEEKPDADRLAQIGRSIPTGSNFGGTTGDKPFVASMGIYVFSRDVLLETLERHGGTDFGKEIIPAALGTHRVKAYLYRGYWADVGTIPSFYDANIMLTRPGAPFRFYDPRRPIYTHPRFLPGARFNGCAVNNAIIVEGCFLDQCRVDESIVGIRTHIGRGSQIRRSVLLGADYYESEEEAPARGNRPPLGIGRDVILDGIIVDKNARIGDGVRLTSQPGLPDSDGPGYVVRDGIVIVPKDATVPPNTHM
jgi:glucose-1-phosphate adenylyltransferase